MSYDDLFWRLYFVIRLVMTALVVLWLVYGVVHYGGEWTGCADANTLRACEQP